MAKTLTFIFAVFASCNIAAATPGSVLPLAVETEEYRVEVVKFYDREHSRRTNWKVRTYTLELTCKITGKVRQVEIGGDELEYSLPLQNIRIFKDLAVISTEKHIFVLSLKTGKPLKLMRVLHNASSPSGRWIACKEWEFPSMPDAMVGAVITVLDLESLERSVVFPETDLVNGPHDWRPPSDFEPYYTLWNEDPAQRCQMYGFQWNDDSTRFAFFCTFYLTKRGRYREAYDQRSRGLVVVSLNSLKQADFEMFKLTDDLYFDSNAGPWDPRDIKTDEVGWSDKDIFEIRLAPKPGLRDRIVIDTLKGEIQSLGREERSSKNPP